MAKYAHGQIVDSLPGETKPLPADFALQDPADLIASASEAVRQVIDEASRRIGGADQDAAQAVIGIGVDFTSCTMLPALAGRHAALPQPSGSPTNRWPGRNCGNITAPRRKRTGSTDRP